MGIRSFRKDDIDRIAQIGDEAWKEIYDGFCDQVGEDIVEQYTGGRRTCKGISLRKFAESEPDHILIHEEESGQISGFLTFQLDEAHKVGIISNNAVDVAFKGKGIAQKLYAKAFEIFREKGMTLARVTTGLDEAHAPARKAYERAGFDRSGMPSVSYFKKLS